MGESSRQSANLLHYVILVSPAKVREQNKEYGCLTVLTRPIYRPFWMEAVLEPVASGQSIGLTKGLELLNALLLPVPAHKRVEDCEDVTPVFNHTGKNIA